MMRRLAALLLALAAVVGLTVSASAPAAALPDPGDAAEIVCRVGTSSIWDVIPGDGLVTRPSDSVTGSEVCEKVDEAVEKAMKAPWKAVWDSIVGDIIRSAQDATTWSLKKTLTFSLEGPSVDLEGTGLWGGKATLAGMLAWLGLLIAVAGVMWNLAKMALTGQAKHAGRAMGGWIENLVLSFLGVGLFGLLLVAGDAMTTGLVDATFADDGAAYEQILTVLVPATVINPIIALCMVGALLLIGFVQMVLIFLRQAAIPIICLLLPVAGGGRTGGETTRKWAPTLITSGLVIIAYKPIVAVIICVGFAQLGHPESVVAWLRGVATLFLAIVAPAPLTKIFAPFGAAVGSAMGSGGAGGALSAAAGYLGAKKEKSGDSGGDRGHAPADPVSHAQYVDQVRPGAGQNPGRSGGGGEGRDGGQGGDAQAQAARNESSRVPGQAGAAGADGADAAAAGSSSPTATGAGTAAAAGAASATGAAGVGIQVLDGVNDAIQGASGQMGGGNQL
ncbi:hypothetical protein ROS62_29455 [Streptomyces sp. DSM 41972]|uniref:TrbL/VirB6 plasmid conjugal transfer protein n=1 Tax=Streptomyces althioticus subsp. attaecolombicae TaxID=3075534 RepID=A0ABU3I748_9ACTN|nr:hypothetical protein [Streptomyces sp. DSM 41972]